MDFLWNNKAGRQRNFNTGALVMSRFGGNQARVLTERHSLTGPAGESGANIARGRGRGWRGVGSDCLDG